MDDDENKMISCARAAHEVNRAYCLAIGDTSQEPWDSSPQWQKDSAVQGVAKRLAGASPEELHKSWLAAKLADGWSLGDVKDVEKKTHPAMIPYADLPRSQRVKDRLFGSTVTEMAIALGLPVAPVVGSASDEE